MGKYLRHSFTAVLLGLLIACSGGGGGDSAAGVDPGPAPPGGPVTPPEPQFPNTNPSPYADAQELFAFITSVTIPEDGRPVVEWRVTDGDNVPIIDLGDRNVRFTLAKLMGSSLGSMTGAWQSYINDIEEPTPGIGPATADKLQATYERPGDTDDGEFTNNGDGTYRYRFELNLNALDPTVLAQAATQGLNLDYEPGLTHRVAAQFDGSNDAANPVYDWVPASGEKSPFNMDIAATASCNGCHDPLGIHGGNRREVQYCVTCHNPGSTDANSGNTVDLKVMIHKIHMGRNLPSVGDGAEYAIWGFRDSKHDYSELGYPQDIRNCVNCHAGSLTGAGREEELTLTSAGDNWTQYPSQAACGSCHDDLDFSEHAGGQADDSGCASCHSTGGVAGSIEESHIILLEEARKAFQAQILAVSNSMPGQTPVIHFKVSNPLEGSDYDVTTDPVFTDSGGSLNVKMSWDTRDYTNTGNGEDNANSVSASAVSEAVSNGDGSFRITMPLAIPDGSAAPFLAASGSGVATIEGHPVVDFDEDGELDNVPVGDAHLFFSIDEADGEPSDRRESVDILQCNTCHSSLILHGSNRADNIDSCVTCHNPRNTDLRRRAGAEEPPIDGKKEESVHFKTMIHAIHAAGIRENPLLVYGFGGTAHLFNEEEVHFPGDLANCTSCHTSDGFLLPLPATALGTTVDTGDDLQDPTDDTVVTPATAACASCHDGAEARTHMTLQGGNFATTQAAIDDGDVVETCAVCHGEGRDADVAEVHRVHPKPL